ncbi:nucleotide-binding alpha-beta plait domain-containing protein [Tanacetum coccineum]
MVKDAEKYKHEDQEYKKKADEYIALEDCLYKMMKKIKERSIRNNHVLEEIKRVMADTTTWLEDNQVAPFAELELKKFCLSGKLTNLGKSIRMHPENQLRGLEVYAAFTHLCFMDDVELVTTINDETLNKHVDQVGSMLIGPKGVKSSKKVMAGEYFAFYQQVILEVMSRIGICCSIHSPHSPYFFLDEGSRKNGDGTKGTVNSYVHAVTGYQGHKESMDNTPTMVLDETCLNNQEYSLCLLGKVKEFASLTNLKVVLAKEGFSNFEIKYMGGFWVMIVFQDDETKNRFQSNVAAGSWFSQIIQAHNEFNLEERVMWVEIEGVPCKWWSKNTFKRIASRWGTMLNGEELEEGGFHSNRLCICTKMKTVLVESFKMVYRGKVCWVRAIEVPGWVPDFEEDSDVESNDGSHEDEVQGVTSGDRNNLEGDSDVDEVLETCFEDESIKQSMDENFVRQSEPQSEDPFGIYEVLNKKMNVCNNGSMSEGSRKYPPGFTPNDAGATPLDVPDDASDENRTSNGKEDGGSVEKQTRVRNAVCTDANESMCSGHFKKSVAPRTGGSIIQLIDDLVTVGQTMGYDMTGCIKNLEEIIKSQGVNDVHR